MAQLGNSGLSVSACDQLGSFEQIISAEASWFCFLSFILSGPSSAKTTFFLHTEGKFSPRGPWFWFDYPCTILRIIISVVLGRERWVSCTFWSSSFKNPFFFPQNVTVEGECVTARLENASQTALNFLLAQTAQPSVRWLSWEHQKLILFFSSDACKY